MFDPQIKNEISTAGRDPMLAVRELLSAQEISLVALGERHIAQNPHRRFGMELMKQSESRFVHTLALELPRAAQPDLDRFNRRMFANLPAALESYSASLFCASEPNSLNSDLMPDPYFFGMLDAAREAGLQFLATDKERASGNELWNNPEFAETPRDNQMCSTILASIRDNLSRKLIIWGGSNHLYTRPESQRGKFLSLAELLRANGQRLYSIAAIFGNETSKSEEQLAFTALFQYAQELEQPTFVPMKCAPRLATLLVGHDRRCPWGSCQDSASALVRCPGLAHGICPSEGMVPIQCGYWDALIFYPSTGSHTKSSRP